MKIKVDKIFDGQSTIFISKIEDGNVEYTFAFDHEREEYCVIKRIDGIEVGSLNMCGEPVPSLEDINTIINPNKMN